MMTRDPYSYTTPPTQIPITSPLHPPFVEYPTYFKLLQVRLCRYRGQSHNVQPRHEVYPTPTPLRKLFVTPYPLHSQTFLSL
eukprot:523044-Hanusia_phi.AAC.1